MSYEQYLEVCARVPTVTQWVKNLTSILEDSGSVSGLVQGVKDPTLPQACGVGYRCGLDLALL